MAGEKSINASWIEEAAKATRTMAVDSAGTAVHSAPVQRAMTFQRVSGVAGNTTITAGARSITVAVISSGPDNDSPTVDVGEGPVYAGVAGNNFTWSAPNNDTLEALVLGTESDDVVIITTVR